MSSDFKRTGRSYQSVENARCESNLTTLKHNSGVSFQAQKKSQGQVDQQYHAGGKRIEYLESSGNRHSFDKFEESFVTPSKTSRNNSSSSSSSSSGIINNTRVIAGNSISSGLESAVGPGVMMPPRSLFNNKQMMALFKQRSISGISEMDSGSAKAGMVPMDPPSIGSRAQQQDSTRSANEQLYNSTLASQTLNTSYNNHFAYGTQHASAVPYQYPEERTYRGQHVDQYVGGGPMPLTGAAAFSVPPQSNMATTHIPKHQVDDINWDQEDVETLRGLLDLGERAKWKTHF